MSQDNEVTLSIVQHNTVLLTVDSLHPHPLNRPATGINRDQVDVLKTLIGQNGYNGSKPITVRKVDDEYQIIEGHHRVIAATELGYKELPCVIEDLDDVETNLLLLSSNQQEGNDPLDIGLNALDTVEKSKGGRGVRSELSVRGFADALGKSHPYLVQVTQAAEVYKLVTRVTSFKAAGIHRNLAEIHAAPNWLWSALVKQMIESGWTVQITRDKVGAFKEVSDPPSWADSDRIADALVSGAMKIAEIARLQKLVDNAKVTGEFKSHLMTAIESDSPSLLSEVQAIVAYWEKEQADFDESERQEMLTKQRESESARQQVNKMRQNISLEEWKVLSPAEKEEIIVPIPGDGGVFNKQDSADIEWAQWSWNPVTGCLHSCSYCYARDIANSAKMKPYYPNGFAPSFRSNALNAPKNTKVPKEAATDARFKNVFTCSMADLFGRWVPKEWIDAVMLSVRGNPQWDFLFLTKFPQRLSEIEIPENAWMGTTVDLQARVANAEKAFEKVSCRVKWLSVEPMLEPLKFTRLDLFDWVVIGGASPAEGTRDKDGNMQKWNVPYEWIHDLYDQCREAGTKIYMKSNLGVANRVLELPMNLPLVGDPKRAPDEFLYLGK